MANFNFNKVIIGGRLTEDPELKTTSSGISVTTFTVAVNRRKSSSEDNQADFFKVTAWRQTAEFISRFFRKASSICITGTLQNRNWTDNNGVKHYVTEIVADDAVFVDSKSESPVANSQYAPQPFVPDTYNADNAFASPAANTEAPKFEEIGDDEELPF